MILVWSEEEEKEGEEEEGNKVTNVQNVHRWLNKIPLPDPPFNLQRNPGQNSIFPQEESVYSDTHICPTKIYLSTCLN